MTSEPIHAGGAAGHYGNSPAIGGVGYPPPSLAPYVVRIDIDAAGHAEVDSRRPRGTVVAALRRLADELEAGA